MRGYINSNFEPITKIILTFNGKAKAFSAIIDTGFNGFISVPHKINEKKYTYILSNKSNDILIGTKLLINKILTINFKNKTLNIKYA
jgi:predicted aspartyl protease